MQDFGCPDLDFGVVYTSRLVRAADEQELIISLEGCQFLRIHTRQIILADTDRSNGVCRVLELGSRAVFHDGVREMGFRFDPSRISRGTSNEKQQHAHRVVEPRRTIPIHRSGRPLFCVFSAVNLPMHCSSGYSSFFDIYTTNVQYSCLYLQ